MIIKATLGTLVILLIVVVAVSYYINKEGFDDISNGYLSGISKDLGGAIKTVTPDAASPNADLPNSVQAPSQSAESVPKRADVVPEVSLSGSGYEAMNLQQKAELLKDIQKVVRNEILSSRSTKPIISGETRKSNDTDSTAQGKEYEESCYKDTEERCPTNPDGSCPPVPDMTQYIKKDAIPCWGCSLDY